MLGPIKTIVAAATAVAALLLISGCQSPEELRQQEYERQQQQELESARREQQFEMLSTQMRERCEAYGFPASSEALANCVRSEVQKAQAANAASQVRVRQVAACKQAMALRPASGGFGEVMANMAKCDSDPQAQLRSQGYDCTRNFDGSVSCRQK